MYRGRAVALSTLSSILSSKQTLSSLLPKKEPYLLLPSHSSRAVPALSGFPQIGEDARLFIRMGRKLFGIKIRELMGLGKEEKKEPKDWESLPSPPFDFCAEIPGGGGDDDDRDDHIGIAPHHFVFDSKLYLARGGLFGFFKQLRYVNEEYEAPPADGSIPWCKIYEFCMNNKKLSPADSNTVPPLPTPHRPNFLGNIIPDDYDHVYCLVYYGFKERPEWEGLWVLSNSTPRMWKRLPSPPFLDCSEFGKCCFVSQGKLLFYYGKGNMASFNPTTTKWTHLEPDVLDSFPMDESLGVYGYGFPSVTVSPLNNNRDLALSCLSDHIDEYLIEPGFELGVYKAGPIKVAPYLMNEKNGVGFRYPPLYECFDGVPPHSSSYEWLADLGNGMVCALHYSGTPYHDNFRSPILFVCVFTISEKEGQELSVDVVSKRSFTLKECGFASYVEPFVLLTPTKGKAAA